MNPQPVSLADELRKVEAKWRIAGNFSQIICADELSALLDQHKVAVPAIPADLIQPIATNVPLDEHEHKPGGFCVGCAELTGWKRGNVSATSGLLHNTLPAVAEPTRAFVCPFCGKTFSDISYAPNGILCPDCPPSAHAADQPKLTEEQVRLTYQRYNKGSFTNWPSIVQELNRLLTSPVAPPPRPLVPLADVLAEFSLRCPNCASPSLTSTNDRQHRCLHCMTKCTDETALPSIATIRATAAKQAREGALEEVAQHEPQMYMKDGPITGVNGAYTIAFSGCSCGWNRDGMASEKEKWGDHIRGLAAQPSPQTKG